MASEERRQELLGVQYADAPYSLSHFYAAFAAKLSKRVASGGGACDGLRTATGSIGHAPVNHRRSITTVEAIDLPIRRTAVDRHVARRSVDMRL